MGISVTGPLRTRKKIMSRENLHKRENTRSRTSMRDKLVEKQKAVDEHESNFTAGRINVRERYLHRTGIRGRKSWIFFCVLYLLALVVIVNLVMLVILYNVLQIDKDGMKCLSFFENKMVRWHCSSDMNSITLYKNQAGSFKDHNLHIEAEEDKVVFHGGPLTNSAEIHVGPDKTEILAKRGFRFVDPYVKKTILNLNGSVWHVNPESVKASTVSGDSLVSHRVVSNENENLTVAAEKEISVEGHEGVFFDGKMLRFHAEQDVSLLSKEIVFDASGGVYFGDRFPVADSGSPSAEVYKLCACVNNGKLFRVKATVNNSTCATAEIIC